MKPCKATRIVPGECFPPLVQYTTNQPGTDRPLTEKNSPQLLPQFAGTAQPVKSKMSGFRIGRVGIQLALLLGSPIGVEGQKSFQQ